MFCVCFRLQQAQLLRRRMAVMNTRTAAPTVQSMSASTMQTASMSSGGNSGGMSPSSVSSPGSMMGGMGSPHQPGIGLKPGTQTPPANVLQVVKQVIYFAENQFEYLVFNSFRIILRLGSRRSCQTASSSWRWIWKGSTDRCTNATARNATYHGRPYGWHAESATTGCCINGRPRNKC